VNSFTANPIKTVKPIRWIGALQGLRAIAFLAIYLSYLWRKLSTNLQSDLDVIAIDRVRQGK
jgi:hypothetical protein